MLHLQCSSFPNTAGLPSPKGINTYMNVYVDINPLTHRIFYVGVGSDLRCNISKRNKLHALVVESLPSKVFHRRIVYRDILPEKAYRIETQIIKKCGRLCNNTGYLANIHPG